MDSELTIAQVAAQTGLSAATLRYYEAEGLIEALPRRPSQARRYGSGVLKTLDVIMVLRTCGFGMQDLRRVLGVKQPGMGAEQRLHAADAELRRLQEELSCRAAQLAQAQTLIAGWQAEVAQALAGEMLGCQADTGQAATTPARPAAPSRAVRG